MNSTEDIYIIENNIGDLVPLTNNDALARNVDK